MKRKSLILLLSLMQSFSVALSQPAFKSIAIGIEGGTTGIGAQISIPIISNHVILTGGYDRLALSASFSTSVDGSPIDDQIALKVDRLNRKMMGAETVTINTRFNEIDLDITPRVNLSAAKAMLEIYPFNLSSIHITAGAYFGATSNIIDARAVSGDNFSVTWDKLRQEVASEASRIETKYPIYTLNANTDELREIANLDIESAKGNLQGKTYALKKNGDEAYADMAIEVAKVRPYLGLGFGRSVPRKRLGVQFDLGLMYIGKPMLLSDNEVEYDSSAISLDDGYEAYIDMLSNLKFYPQLSLKLICRLF